MTTRYPTHDLEALIVGQSSSATEINSISDSLLLSIYDSQLGGHLGSEAT